MSLGQQLTQFIAVGVVNGAIYALLGLGLVVIYSVTRAVNVAQGEFAALGALLAATLASAGWPAEVVLPAGTAASALLGLLTYLGGIRPVRTASPLVLIIVTLAMHLTLKGLLLLVWGTDPYALPPFSQGAPLRILGAVVARQSLWILGTVVAALMVLYGFFGYTLYGKALRACAINELAARLMGIRPQTMGAIAWTLAGALGGLAGVLITPLTLATYDMGLMLGLKGFVGAVAAGLTSYPLAVLGCLLFGIVESLVAGLLPSGYRDAIAFGVLVVALLTRAVLALRQGVLVKEEVLSE
ncbi:MAG: branched-chain amino acid ABC transporter permease [Armatimonadota bacterium]|nr:branched-chain amino acid ABC transporter permease [Armatimonadota bacterium]MDR7443832.1 branched-chain amino acid ABC transporter permease [Armatimonadota bacterium]MDR7568999.1 branched-chain amino acid ABC transporter permease [Armatimonadota bacterium]MDR7613888.1 branched-chain amino acid ABC transporter permease [Armatimonadota bacterium]